MAHAPSRLYPAPRRLASGPWVGVRDATDPIVSPGGAGEGDGVNYLLSAVNMYLAAGPFGRAWVGRPGIVPLGANTSGGGIWDTIWDTIWGDLWSTTAPYAVLVGGGTGQAISTWTKADGTRYTIAICGGRFFTLNWATGVWTEVITAANLTSKSVSLSASSRVALVPFAGVLVVSDGVNTPWTWDGTTGAGGVTKLTNAPVFYGPPRVYYAKLCGIKAVERNTWVWSEEAQPNVGYEAGGYNNAWTLGLATNANVLTGMAATNEALIFYRDRSITTVTGALNRDFQTAGTRSSVDETIGTTAPWAVQILSNIVFAPDADARPHGVVLGADIQRLWKDCEVISREVIRSSLANAQTVRMLATNVALMGVGLSSSTDDTLMVFDLTTGQYMGYWNGLRMDCLGEVIDDTGNPRVACFGAGTGVPYVFELPSTGTFSDQVSTGTVAISHSVKPRFLFRDLDREIIVDRISFGLGTVGTSQCSIGYDTTRATFDPLSIALAATSTGGVYDVAVYDTAMYASDQKDRRAEVGCMGMGRWVVPEFRHTVLAETCSVTDCRVTAFEVGADPDIP